MIKRGRKEEDLRQCVQDKKSQSGSGRPPLIGRTNAPLLASGQKGLWMDRWARLMDRSQTVKGQWTGNEAPTWTQ